MVNVCTIGNGGSTGGRVGGGTGGSCGSSDVGCRVVDGGCGERCTVEGAAHATDGNDDAGRLLRVVGDEGRGASGSC